MATINATISIGSDILNYPVSISKTMTMHKLQSSVGLEESTGLSNKIHAARIGKEAFLLPETLTNPFTLEGPFIKNLSMVKLLVKLLLAGPYTYLHDLHMLYLAFHYLLKK